MNDFFLLSDEYGKNDETNALLTARDGSGGIVSISIFSRDDDDPTIELTADQTRQLVDHLTERLRDVAE